MARKIKEKTNYERVAEYRKDPVKFFTDCLDVDPKHIWPKMREIIESVRDNSKTVVLAGHSLSKTYTAGRLPLWFLLCHSPAVVVTTAPTHKQVEELLWRELRAAHGNAKMPIGGKLTRTKLDFQEESGEKWYAIGFSTKPETVTGEATAMQGYHGENIMVIFDEAAGVHPLIWKASRYLLTSGFWRWLAIGNPVSPTGDFVECNKASGWNVINISVKDTPNFKESREVIPGISGREFEEDVRLRFGEESNEYKIRVLGIKPDYSDQTYFGKEMAAAKAKGQIGFYPPEPMLKVYTVWDIGHMHTVIWFMQFIRDHIRLIDFYYDSKGLGLPRYAAMLQQKAQQLDYTYAEHFAPWDVAGSENRPQRLGSNAKSFQTGKYTTDIAESLGIPFHVLQKYSPEVQIAAARDLIRLCQFHEPTTKEGLQGLLSYRRKINPALSTMERPVYHEHPVKDWTEHVGSAWCGLAMAYRFELQIDSIPIGWPQAQPEHDYMEPATEKFDPLRHGLVHSK